MDLKRVLQISVLVFLLFPAGIYGQSLQLADSLISIGQNYREKGNYPHAEFYYGQALIIYKKLQDSTQWRTRAIDYAEILIDQAKHEEALKLLKTLRQSSGDNADLSQQTRIENDIGLIYKKMNHHDEALVHYQNAIELALSGNDAYQVAILYDNIGGLHLNLGNFSKALEYRKRSLELFQKLGKKPNQAIVLNNIGFIYMNLSIYDRALEYFSKSLNLRQEMENAALLSLAYGNMARVLSYLGHYDQALIAYKKGLDYVAKTGNPVKEAQILTNLGNLYNTLGDPKKSLEYYQESLELVLQHNITIPSELSTKYKNIAVRQKELGRIKEARKNFKKALAYRKQSGDIRKLSLSYMDMAQLEMISQNFEAASEYAHLGKEIADSTQIIDLVIESRILMGEINMRTGNTAAALAHFKEAYQRSRTLSENNRLIPLTKIAKTLNVLESDSAIYYGNEVIKIIESTRQHAGEITGLKTGYFENYSDFYVDLASWYLKYRKDVSRAYELVEASKARALSDELVEASQNLDEVLPEHVRIEKNRKLEQIENIFTQLDETTDSSERDQIKKKLREAELDYAAFMNQVRAENPQYKQIRYPSPMDLPSAQALCGNNTAILEFSFSSNGLVAFLITGKSVRAEFIDIPTTANGQNKMTELVESYRDDILAHIPVGKLKARGQGLTDSLILPFEKQLSAYSNLIIVPDGVLAYLPFEALPFDNRFLIEEFNIKYAPSLTTFSLLNKPESSYKMDLLAIAGANYSGRASSSGSPDLSTRSRSYPPLPATVAEVDSIASKFQRASIFKEGDLNERLIKQMLRSNYRYIHLATHGIIDEDYPGLSGLVLSGAGTSNLSTKEDGMLRSSEIYQLNINSDMVVLSACNTGLGKIVKGEGILGLQRSFFYAGVPTVTVSLWNVYDRSTAFLMNDFYAALQSKKESGRAKTLWADFLRWVGWDESIPYGNSAPAMREAKLKMLNHPLLHHPVYWAPFIVVGR